MSRYQRLGAQGSRLGSFEGHGVSGHGFGDLGQLDAQAQRQLQELQSDMQKAEILMGQGPAYFQQPRTDWSYFMFRSGSGRSAVEVRSLAPTEMAGIQNRASQPQDSGASAGEVLTGISAILAPLAQLGVGIYGAQQNAKLQKLQMKGGGYQQQPIIMPAQSSNTGIIIAVVVVFIIMGMMLMMMKGKK